MATIEPSIGKADAHVAISVQGMLCRILSYVSSRVMGYSFTGWQGQRNGMHRTHPVHLAFISPSTKNIEYFAASFFVVHAQNTIFIRKNMTSNVFASSSVAINASMSIYHFLMDQVRIAFSHSCSQRHTPILDFSRDSWLDVVKQDARSEECCHRWPKVLLVDPGPSFSQGTYGKSNFTSAGENAR